MVDRRTIRQWLGPRSEETRTFVGLTAICVALFYGPVVLGQVFFQRDIGMWLYPQIEAFVRSIAAGSWPVWDDSRGFGQALLADPSAEILYPVTWLNLIMQPWTFYTFSVVLHFLFSGVGLALLARRWGMSPIGAGLGACIWLASGPFLSLASLPHHMVGAAFIPWVFLTADAALDRGGRRTTFWWAAAMTGQILAGSADMVVMTDLALATYILGHHVHWRDLWQARNRSLVWTGLLALLVALGLSAAQWLPTLTTAIGSARFSLSAEERTVWSLHPLRLLEVALQFRWNELPLGPSLAASILEMREPWLRSIYAGVPVLALLGAALAARNVPRRGFLFALGLTAVLVSLGRYWVAYDAITFLLPPLRIFRFPQKAMLMAAFAGSLLAAMGWDACRGADRVPAGRWRRAVVVPLAAFVACALVALYATGPGAERWGSLLAVGAEASPSALLAPAMSRLKVGAFTAAVALGLGLVCRRRPEHAARALAGLVIADLLMAHADFHPSAPRELFEYRPEVLGKLVPPPDGRVYVYDYSVATPEKRARYPAMANVYRAGPLPPGWSMPEGMRIVLGAQSYLNPPTNVRFGLDGSYDWDLLGLEAASLTKLKRYLREAEDTPAHLRLLQAGAVRNVLALEPATWWRDLTPLDVVPGFFAKPIHVFAVPASLPRTYAVGRAIIADHAREIETLTDPAFDLRRAVLLEPGAPALESPSFTGESRVVLRKPDRVVVEADLGASGYVVLVDGWDAGWIATVDGSRTPVLRANVAFRAVVVPSGRHVIEFIYRPWPLRLGLGVSAATLAALVLAAGFRKWRGTPPQAVSRSG